MSADDTGPHYSDINIECPLFWQLQKFLRAEGLCAPGREIIHARRFMREYWLVPADQHEGPRKERQQWRILKHSTKLR